MIMLRSGCIFFLLLVLQACSFSGSAPPEEHFYRLAVAGADSSFAQPLYKNIYIRPVMADGIYNERAMLYVEDDSPLEVRRYHYHYWITTPARLVQEEFRSYLLSTGITRQLLSQQPGEPELVLAIQLVKFERLVGNGQRVLVALDMDIHQAGQSEAILHKTYRAELPADTTMHDTAAAFGQALGTVFKAISDDLATLKKY
ncbi:MAG: ABC-type transport auxiliary lipoprotein family protein [Gammaproteobacteria bacterium]|nr:ABC-type transport auxiliary lipoprotein family protein [Gammaproteobacteria bacterium]MDH5735280.1 ABC-type transport auxiliary lipoprotein family protein [Gammaproteobacteria bacterium]